MIQVMIAQLDDNGIFQRIFSYSRHPHEIIALIDRIERAYNMDHTIVYADGQAIAGHGVSREMAARRQAPFYTASLNEVSE